MNMQGFKAANKLNFKKLSVAQKFSFQQDKDRKYKAKSTMEWFEMKHIQVIQN